MKLRSLFLATLAAMAMASCSNENDPIDNGGNNEAEKTALLDLGFAFPKAAATKANDDKEAGEEVEYEFDKVAIIIAYTGENNNRTVEMLNRTDFSPTKASVGTDKVVIYTKQAISVSPGTANIYAILNPQQSKEELESSTTTWGGLATKDITGDFSLDILTKTNNPAESNKFLMTSALSGTDAVNNITFTKGQANNVTIKVNRVVAKLVEATETCEFLTQSDNNKAIESGLIEKEGNPAIQSITLTQATYVNLAKTSSVFPYTTFSATMEFWQEYTAKTEEAAQADDDKTSTAADGGYKYFNMTPENDETKVHYCYENASENNPTGIIYEAQVKWNTTKESDNTSTDNTSTDNTFYIAAGKLYLSYNELKKEFRECPNEDESPAKFAEKHIRKYVNGKCYYYQPIKTISDASDGESKIVRNNLYKLKVTGINKIGSSTVTPDAEETLMNLEIQVMPWTVNENNFVLE